MSKMKTKDSNPQTWQLQNIRFTAFISGSPELSLEQITGEPPEHAIDSPKVGIYEEVGQFNANTLNLTRQPGRVDFSWSVSPNPAIQIESLGEYPEVAETFKELVRKLLAQNISINRMAFGSFFLTKVESFEDGHKFIKPFVPNSINLQGAHDFSYQINRPRHSKSVEELSINRLAIWTVGLMQKVHIQFPGGSVNPEGQYMCRLQLDINTDFSHHQIFDKSKASMLLEELDELATQILTKGDCV